MTKESVEDFRSKLVSSSSGFSLDKSEGNSEEQLEILSSSRLGYIWSINILQNTYLSRVFGGNWEGKLSSMNNFSGCFAFMFSSLVHGS